MSDKPNNLPELVKFNSDESAAYFRQWLVWLGVGSAGSAIALSSLAAHLPDPNYGFKLIIPSLWMFLLGVVLAGASVLALSKKHSSMAEHFANAHNREELKRLITSTPEIVAAPQSLADRENLQRNEWIKQHDKIHKIAEKFWKARTIWHRILIACCSISALMFVAGMALPLLQITLGKSLKP